MGMEQQMHPIVLFGAGRIGEIHARNIAAHPRLRLAAVADTNLAAAQALADRHGAQAMPPEAALTLADIAGAVVASPTATHVEYTLAAARAGWAVLCEKPLDLDLDSAVAAARDLAALDARVLLGFNRRFDPDFAVLQEQLAAGAIGTLETLHIISHDPAPPPPAYVAGSGGLFKDMVIHDFDMARWLLGEDPVAIFASSACLIDPQIAAAGDVDTAKTILRTASGRLCMISSSRRSGYGYDQRIEAFGSQGLLRVGNPARNAVEHWSLAGTATAPFETFFLDRYATAYVREIDHFAQVLDGTLPRIGVRDGVQALALAQAAQRSAASGVMEPVGVF